MLGSRRGKPGAVAPATAAMATDSSVPIMMDGDEMKDEPRVSEGEYEVKPEGHVKCWSLLSALPCLEIFVLN